MPDGHQNVVLDLSHIQKAYGNTRALQDVSMSVRPGEVRALMGKNGAGKSTLVRIISGVEQPDAGDVAVAGVSHVFRSPSEALNAGVATVHQELTIVPSLTVAENISLGRWPSKFGVVDRRKIHELARDALDMLSEHLDLDREAGSYGLAHRQIMEIARSLSFNPSVLLLDEPTSSLPKSEVDALLALVRKLAERGVAVIYVSHRMDEISQVADSVTVLRDGRLVDTLSINEATVGRIAQLMVGEDFKTTTRVMPPPDAGKIALSVRELRWIREQPPLNLDVKAGEIVGIAGLLGAGRTELLECVAGLRRRQTGTVAAFSDIVASSVSDSMAAGIALVPEDRKHDGLVLNLPISQNLTMSSLSKVASWGFLSSSREAKIAAGSRDTLSIKAPSLQDEANSLSGGNQQKVVIGRCLNADARILLLDEPTRGVDIEAKHQIYDLIETFAAEGKAVVFVSSEYEELLELCHRILIIADGEIVGTFDPESGGIDRLMAVLLSKAAPVDQPEINPEPSIPHIAHETASHQK